MYFFSFADINCKKKVYFLNISRLQYYNILCKLVVFISIQF